jgi:hypothetical protein
MLVSISYKLIPIFLKDQVIQHTRIFGPIRRLDGPSKTILPFLNASMSSINE